MNATAPDAANPSQHDRPQRRTLLVFCLFFYLIAIFHGMRSALVPTAPALSDLALPVALAICLCSWALADARDRQRPIPRSLQFWFYLFAPLVVPGYILGTRGWRGLAWMTLHALAWFALATLAMNLAGYAKRGDAWWQPLQLQ